MKIEVCVPFPREIHEFLEAQVFFLFFKKVEDPMGVVLHGAMELFYEVTQNFARCNTMRVEGAPEADTFKLGEVLEQVRLSPRFAEYNLVLDEKAQAIADWIIKHTPCANDAEVILASVYCLEWVVGIITQAGCLFLPVPEPDGSYAWTPCDVPILRRYKGSFYH